MTCCWRIEPIILYLQNKNYKKNKKNEIKNLHL